MIRPVQLVWIASIGLSMATSAAVFAQPTKVALTIDGDSSSIGLRRAVVGALDNSDVQFVSAKKTTKVIEQLGIGEVASARDARTIAKKLAVNTVIHGAFDESDHTVTFTVFTNGKKSAFTLEVEDAKSERFRKAVRKKMLAKVAVAAPDDEDKGDEDEDKPAKPAKKTAGEDKRASKKTDAKEVADNDKPNARDKGKDKDKAKDPAKDKAEPKSKTKKDDDADEAAADSDDDAKDHKPAHKAKEVASKDADDRDAEDAESDEPSTSAHARVEAPSTATETPGVNLDAVRVDLGASMAGRSLKFQSTAIENAPAAYRGKPVPGGHLEAELYPAALTDRTSLLAGLGIAGDFDQATSFTAPGADGMTPLKVTERHYSVGARFRIAFGHRPTSPTLTVGVGYGARTFAVDHSSGMSIDLPDVNYRMVDPGLSARVPLGRRVALTAGGRALLLTAAGAITNADQYGGAHVVGGTASAGVEVVIGTHLAVRLAAEGTQLDLQFKGAGTLATSRDGDPSTVDVQRAVDRFYGGEATLAVIY